MSVDSFSLSSLLLAGCFYFFLTFNSFLFWLDLLQVREFAKSIDNLSLQLLVPRLIDLSLESSEANTAQKYSFGWQRWKAWARLKLGVPMLLAIPLQVALYLTAFVDRAI